MQNPLGAAFARKVLRCKARDEGRTLVLFDEERNAAAGHFSCKPFGAVLGGAICFVASLANSPAIRLRLASRISPRQAAPRPHGVLHQPAMCHVHALIGNCIDAVPAQRMSGVSMHSIACGITYARANNKRNFLRPCALYSFMMRATLHWICNGIRTRAGLAATHPRRGEFTMKAARG
jgi:hypothetical protein